MGLNDHFTLPTQDEDNAENRVATANIFAPSAVGEEPKLLDNVDFVAVPDNELASNAAAMESICIALRDIQLFSQEVKARGGISMNMAMEALDYLPGLITKDHPKEFYTPHASRTSLSHALEEEEVQTKSLIGRAVEVVRKFFGRIVAWIKGKFDKLFNRDKLDEAKKREEELKKSLEESNAKIAEAAEKYDQLQRSAAQDNDNYLKELAEIKGVEAKLRSSLGESELQNAGLRQTNTTLSADLAKAQQEARVAVERAKAAVQQAKQAEEQLARTGADAAQAKARTQQAEQALQAAEQRARKAEQDANAARGEAAQANQRADVEEGRANALQGRAENAEQRLSGAEDRAAMAEQRANNSDASAVKSYERANQAEAEARQANKELAGAKISIDNLRDSLRDVQSQMRNLDATKSREIAEALDRLEKLQRQAESSRSARLDLQEKNDELRVTVNRIIVKTFGEKITSKKSELSEAYNAFARSRILASPVVAKYMLGNGIQKRAQSISSKADLLVRSNSIIEHVKKIKTALGAIETDPQKMVDALRTIDMGSLGSGDDVSQKTEFSDKDLEGIPAARLEGFIKEMQTATTAAFKQVEAFKFSEISREFEEINKAIQSDSRTKLDYKFANPVIEAYKQLQAHISKLLPFVQRAAQAAHELITLSSELIKVNPARGVFVGSEQFKGFVAAVINETAAYVGVSSSFIRAEDNDIMGLALSALSQEQR